MNIRAFQEFDLEELRRIHEKYYKEEFSLNDFCQRYIDFSVIEDQGQIVCAGGIRSIAESVIMTNKSLDSKTKREALYHMLEIQSYVTKQSGYNQLHAFVQDDIWKHRLYKTGFKDCKGSALVLEIK